jgi:agmatinase
LPAAESIRDRKITLFNRTKWGYDSGGAFMTSTYLEDMRDLGGQDVVVIGAPYDGGATYRSGTRLGPESMRKMSRLQRSYIGEYGIDLDESLTMVDAGDVFVIPGNIEKSFDQIAKAVAYSAERGVMPIVLGGDHSIGYPDVRGLAPFVDGNIGIIHFDRHIDIVEYGMDERHNASPFFHATNIPNAPPSNLVQIGIGSMLMNRGGMKVARERETTVISLRDIDRYGLDRIIEYALEIAWKNAKAVWISLDIDVVDPAFAPGTGVHAPGGLTSREVLTMLREVASEGMIGMEVAEVSPPYDVADMTALLGVYAILECLGAMIQAGKVGHGPSGNEIGTSARTGGPAE